MNLSLSIFNRSEEQKQARREAKERRQAERALRKQQLDEAQFYAAMIPNALARLKIASMTKEKGKVQINKVKLRPPVLIHEDYYMFEVQTARLPFGVKIDHLRDPETLVTLSAACRTEVEVKFHPAEGFWYVVPRRGGLGIIPRIIDYTDVLDMMPKSANIWSFPIGVSENKRLNWIDLRQTPHMMIIGSTGTGKSVFLKAMIFTLAMNCSPKRLRFVICDYKRGADFKPLAQLPHLGTPLPVGYSERVIGLNEDTGEMEKEKTADYMDRIIIHIDELMEVLMWCRKEIDRRNGMFDQDVTDIIRWNAKHRRNPMPHVMIIIDEIGVIMNRLPNKQQAVLTEYLADVAMLGRSAGIHLIMGLQKLVKRVLDGAISDNIEARIVGACASGPQSAMAMGNGSWAAAKLPKGIKGRAIWRDVDGEIQVQLPWVSPKDAVDLTDAVISRWIGDQDNEDQTAADVLKWCLSEDDGYYHIDHVYQHWKNHGLTRAQVQSIREEYLITVQDGGTVEPLINIDGVEYVLLPHIPGQRPSRLVTKARYDEVMNPPEPEPEPEPELEPEPEPEPEPKHNITALDMFKYAIENENGQFNIKKTFQVFRENGVTRAEIQEIGRTYEGESININDQTYILTPSDAATGRSRTLELVNRNREPRTTKTKTQKPETTDQDLGDGAQNENSAIPDWLEDLEKIQN